MPLLRNICIERIASLGTFSVVYRNLESISWLDSKLCTRDLFTRIPNLKNLGIDDGFDENNIDCFYNCVHFEQLEKLSIKRSLHIHIPCYGTEWASFVPNLKKLKFYKTHLSWSDLTFIGMLPNLEVLKLKNAIARDARMWEASEEGFCKLKRLVIEDTYLERWNAEGDNFPVLECLELHNCHCLQEIPSGFADIITLTLIWLKSCWDSVMTSAKLIQEEQYNNYGNALHLGQLEKLIIKDLHLERIPGSGISWITIVFFQILRRSPKIKFRGTNGLCFWVEVADWSFGLEYNESASGFVLAVGLLL
nr:putative late blight resistance protein homolog R1B-16 [Ipomoea trifida]